MYHFPLYLCSIVAIYLRKRSPCSLLTIHVGLPQFSETAASIWFEIWRVLDPGQQNFDISRQISKKFPSFQAISQKISIFQDKFLKHLDFPGNVKNNFD